ncbi:hypothetical protein DFH09DRAFT_1090363 [Mycena vulgaris]|nr:hypothetical protein DFH09DRAFT_1090363 [Mycena vulgaris]
MDREAVFSRPRVGKTSTVVDIAGCSDVEAIKWHSAPESAEGLIFRMILELGTQCERRQEEEKDTVDRIRTPGNVSGFWGSLVPSLPRTKRRSAARFILRSEEIDRKGSKTKAYILTGCGRRESNPGLPPSTYSWHNVGGMHRAPRPRFNRSAHMPRRIPSLLNHPHVERPGDQTVSTTTYTHHARDRVGDGGHQLGIAIIAPALVHEAARETRSRLPVDEP